jgi:hypothetical protein
MPIKPCVPGLAMCAGLVLAGCTEPTTPSSRTISDTRKAAFDAAALDPSEFTPGSNNPYFPLVPGTTFHYESRTKDGLETQDFTVTSNTKIIQGVTTRVVEDIVRLEGVIIEHTFDWFAQNQVTGDVWYFGEDTRQFDPVTGKLIGREGSWQSGRKGAQAGIIMWGDPAAHVGETYSEEVAPGVAEDMARVVSLDARARVPYGSFDGCLKTENFTPLEPDLREEKYYCPSVGLVLEVTLSGGRERNELVDITTSR